ncbi:MAG: tRNA adenosine deaminase-associated protein [Nocardioidaceae bacterium]|nr:tRNA adenosine deaminase-associated protein [Nocardioidaceae bacterium]MCL2614377.1 tRNA adenosine deaminase-associated protein [Nocardioidaceae bacterium]
MSETFSEELDFAVAAYVDDDGWQVAEMVVDHIGDLDSLAHALRRFPSATGAVGMVAVDEDFFVIARVDPHETRVLLSDVTAATDWEFAASIVEFLGLPLPEDDEDDVEPAGDMDLLSDLGVDPVALAELLDDQEAYPDELLSDIARLLGFGELFDDVVGLASA